MKRLAPLQQRHYRSTHPEAYTELKELYLANASSPDTGSVRDAFRTFARGLGVSSFAVLLPTMTEEPSYAETYASLALSHLPLVDTSRATWQQVMELRSDPESRSQLRRLRLFLFENYLGKPIAYVQDDLARLVDEYDRARKKHGFEAVLSSVSVLLEARALQSAAIASLTTALFGGPLVGLSAGAAIELGHFAVELAKQRAAIRELADGHDMACVLRAQEKLSR